MCNIASLPEINIHDSLLGLFKLYLIVDGFGETFPCYGRSVNERPTTQFGFGPNQIQKGLALH